MHALCIESIVGAHNPNRHGICGWCYRRVEPPAPRPRPYYEFSSAKDRVGITVPLGPMESAYRYFYDPDTHTWGVD